MAFYFVPKLTQKPLHSRSMALMTFWLTLFVSSWAVVPAGAPVPAWIPGVSTLAALVSLVPVLAAVSNLKHTLIGFVPGRTVDPALRCFQLAIPCLLISGVLQALSAVRGIGEPVAFTFFGPGLQALFLGGFIGLNLLGAMLFAIPRIAGFQSSLPAQSGLMVKLAIAATALIAVPLILGGVFQGAAAQNGVLPFGDSLNRAMHFLRLSTLGWLAAVGMAGTWLLAVTRIIVQAGSVAVVACLPGKMKTVSSSGKPSGVAA